MPVRVGQTFDHTLVMNIFIFLAAYIGIAFAGWTLLMAIGVDFMDAMSTVISALSNVGPALGHYGPAFSWAALPDMAKWILSALMLIGRLEIFCVLLLFYPPTWKAG